MPSGVVINYYLTTTNTGPTFPGFRMLMGVGRAIIFYFLPYVTAAISIHKLLV